jgi:hypothetical protein
MLLQGVSGGDHVVLMDYNDIFLPSAGLLVRDFISEGGVACSGVSVGFDDEEDLSGIYTYERVASEGNSLLSGFIPSDDPTFLEEQRFGRGSSLRVRFGYSGMICRGREFIAFYDNIEAIQDRVTAMGYVGVTSPTPLFRLFDIYLKSLKGYGIIPSPYVLERHFGDWY